MRGDQDASQEYEFDEDSLAVRSLPPATARGREAQDAFEVLAARHGQGRRRIFLLGLATVIIFSVIAVFAIDLIRTNSAHRYASASRRKALTSETCDRALDRHRLWFGPVVTSDAMCVEHTSSEDRQDERDPYPRDDFSFLAIGDWGRDGMCCQHDVALEMSLVAKYAPQKFVVALGDNFYEHGIDSPHDSQIDRSWRNVYTNPFAPLKVPWHATLGNHDHMKNAFAQVELSDVEEFWHMPHNFYFETYADDNLFVAFLDTTCMYYNSTILRSFPNETALTSDYCEQQTERLEEELQRTKAGWKLVVGHHPFLSSSKHAGNEKEEQKRLRDRLVPICVKNGVSAYIAGHEHLLEHYVHDGFHSFISGAGSKVRTVSLREPESVFSIGTQGFLQVALRNASSLLHFRFFDLKGAVIHSVFLEQPS